VWMFVFRVEAKMEAGDFSVTSVNTSNITRLINPEDQHLKLHCHKNLKSQLPSLFKFIFSDFSVPEFLFRLYKNTCLKPKLVYPDSCHQNF
jgi:hypothetical protein